MVIVPLMPTICRTVARRETGDSKTVADYTQGCLDGSGLERYNGPQQKRRHNYAYTASNSTVANAANWIGSLKATASTRTDRLACNNNIISFRCSITSNPV